MAKIDIDIANEETNVAALQAADTTLQTDFSDIVSGGGASSSINFLNIQYFSTLEEHVGKVPPEDKKYIDAVGEIYTKDLVDDGILPDYTSSYEGKFTTVSSSDLTSDKTEDTTDGKDADDTDKADDTTEKTEDTTTGGNGDSTSNPEDTTESTENTTEGSEAEETSEVEETTETAENTSEGGSGEETSTPGEGSGNAQNTTGGGTGEGSSTPGEGSGNAEQTTGGGTGEETSGPGEGGGKARNSIAGGSAFGPSSPEDGAGSATGSVLGGLADEAGTSGAGENTTTNTGAGSIADLVASVINGTTGLLGTQAGGTDSLLGAVGGAIQGVSGAGLAGIAGILGGLGALAAGGFAATQSGGKSGGTSLKDIMNADKPSYGGQGISQEMAQFIAGVVSGTTGLTVSELLSGSYPEALAVGQQAFDGMMSLFSEGGKISADEFAFALSGEPYSFMGLTDYQKENAFLNIASMIDQYGGVEGTLSHLDEIIARFKGIGDSADAIRDLIGRTPAEQIEALRGLLDSGNPNIGGTPISREARDFIIKFLENYTGFSIQDLLSGAHPKELQDALAALLEMLEVFEALGNMTREEFEQYIKDLLNGKFAGACGINTFTVKSFKVFLNSVCTRNSLGFADLINSKALLVSALKEYSALKVEIHAMEGLNEQEIGNAIAKFFATGTLIVNGVSVSSNSRAIIKYMLDALCLYLNVSLEELLNNEAHSSMIYLNIHELYKYMVFIGIFVTMNINALQNKMTLMFQGKIMGLLGFTSDEIGESKKILEDYSRKNDIKLDDLLKNPASSQVLFALLKDDDAFKRVCIIFDDLNDNALQVTLANLIDSWKQDFKERMNNVIGFVNRKRLTKIIESTKDNTRSSISLATPDAIAAEIEELLGKSEDELKALLGKIFRGEKNELDGKSLGYSLNYLLRLYLYGLSSYFKVSCELLLKDNRYYDYITYYIRFVPYYLDVIGIDNMFNDNYLFTFFNRVYSGQYPLLIGIDNNKLANLEREFMGIANYKNINISQLLSNTTYADEVVAIVRKDQTNVFMNLFIEKSNYEIQYIINNMITNYKM